MNTTTLSVFHRVQPAFPYLLGQKWTWAAFSCLLLFRIWSPRWSKGACNKETLILRKGVPRNLGTDHLLVLQEVSLELALSSTGAASSHVCEIQAGF